MKASLCDERGCGLKVIYIEKTFKVFLKSYLLDTRQAVNGMEGGVASS